MAKVDLDVLFHETAGELHDTLDYAASPESDGETIQARGYAVTLARRLVAIDDALKLTGGDAYESDDGDDVDIAYHIAEFAKGKRAA